TFEKIFHLLDRATDIEQKTKRELGSGVRQVSLTSHGCNKFQQVCLVGGFKSDMMLNANSSKPQTVIFRSYLVKPLREDRRICTYVRMHVGVDVGMYMCMDGCMYGCMYGRTCTYVYTHQSNQTNHKQSISD